MMDKMRMETADITALNIEKIGALFPNCITEMLDEEKSTAENKVYKKAVNFELLKQMLSKDVVDGNEAYEFTWVGKKASIIEANKPIRKTLRPCKEESVNWDKTENLYIEGDNLEVLKLLQESYLGKVKMIYIDPPYNTGNDFIYNDDFKMSSDEYADKSGETDEEGNRMFKNTDSNGRFHSDWCSMIYPRLMLARNLLSDDGVIFISIDDNEQANLKKICDEVFGASNFIAQIPILSNPRGRQSSNFFAEAHENLLCYSKNYNNTKIHGEPLTDEQKSEYSYFDEMGNYRLLGLRLRGGRATAEEAPSLHFPIYYNIEKNDFYTERKNIDDYEIVPKFSDGRLGTWRWSKQKIIKDKKFLTILPVRDRYDVFEKNYLKENTTRKLKNIWIEKEINYDNSARELTGLELNNYFDYTKPLYLIKKIINSVILNNTSDIILDFFSGSSTTAHAVMQLNAEDGGNRKFIMVQLPELCDETSEAYKAGYKNICEIGKERIRRAGKKILEENKDKEGIENLDIGFRVLKLDDTNMTDVYYSPSEYSQNLLSKLESNVKPDRSDLDLLFGCLLEWGLPLSLPYACEKIGECTVHNYNDGDLIACFDENIAESVIKEIAKKRPLRAVFRDSSFADSPSKINVAEIFKLLAPDTRVKVI